MVTGSGWRITEVNEIMRSTSVNQSCTHDMQGADLPK